MIPAQIRTYLEIAAAVVLAIGFALFVHHERAIGEQKIEASDAKATAAAQRQADAETALNNERAAKADIGADHDQQVVDDYRASHPDGAIRLCRPDNRVAGLPSTGATGGKAPGPGTGPNPVREVPGGSEGPDVSAELDAIVQAAERLAILNADWEHR